MDAHNRDGRDENGDTKQAGLDDSNMANYGSKEHKDARKNAAQSESEFVGAGKNLGLEIWRVENKRTKSDTPDFGIKRWPKEQYGMFHTGDSYLLMNTYVEKGTKKRLYDVHFWLGAESSQDEVGVAAYKAVELDDLLDDAPVQHREVQNQESLLFKSYFGKRGITYLSGGHASGFRKVEKDVYEPRLFQVSRNGVKTACASQIPVSSSNLNEGDCFILDAHEGVYTYLGKQADPFEKSKAAILAANLVSARMGKVKDKKTNLDEAFWKTLGGSAANVKKGSSKPPYSASPVMDSHDLNLFRVSDQQGKMSFSKVKSGVVLQSDLDTKDVFIVDAKLELFVWIGKQSSWGEKSQCMKYATEYLASSGLNKNTPITRIQEGQVNHIFLSILDGKSQTKRQDEGGFFCSIS